MKSNDNHFEGTAITLPLPPLDLTASYEHEIYARFMSHLRTVPSSRPEIRVLAAMQYVADLLDKPDAEIAACLVGLGLRAPRLSFPESYLEFADNALMRDVYEVGCTSGHLRDLQCHWSRIGDDKFAAFRRCYPSLAEGVFAPL